MATYDQWNEALLSYVIEGIPRGMPVYLGIDEDVIVGLGRAVPHVETPSTADTALDDFCAAVTRAVVRDGERVDLSAVGGRTSAGEPRCLAFLAAMVLAASRMADEEDISELNYFRRLRDILALPGERRPRGMHSGSEADEPLWQEWNRWLQECGYLPSALAGGGPRRYIGYPLSQTLLRRADKDRLIRLFAEKHWLADWDADTLVGQVRREDGAHSTYLRDLLAEEAPRRGAVAEAILELYDLWRQDPRPGRERVSGGSRNLRAGIYREYDALLGALVDPAYNLYPYAPRRRAADNLEVIQGDIGRPLRAERPGWFLPLDSVSAAELERGERYRIGQPAEFEWVILPQRSFWLLIQDPENPESGAYASWGRPPLDQPFILLCKVALLPQLGQLRAEGLVGWEGEPVPVLDGGWAELRDCMAEAESEAWSGVFIEDQELFEALRPVVSLSISVSGGLRVPDRAAWVDEYGPEITVGGFDAEAELTVSRVADDRLVYEAVQRTQVPLAVPWPGAGDYRVEATAGGRSVSRLVKLVPWDDLWATEPPRREVVAIGGAQVAGATISRADEGGA